MTDKAAENPIQNAKLAMDCISVYGSILKDNVMEKLYELLNSLYYPENDISCFLRRYSAFCGSFLENSEGRSLRLYILELLLSDDNAFSKRAAAADMDKIDICIMKAVKNDLLCLGVAFSLTSDCIKSYARSIYGSHPMYRDIIDRLPEWDCNGGDALLSMQSFYVSSPEQLLKKLAEFHRANGSGIFARFRSFIWEDSGNGCGNLKGVRDNDPVRFSDLIGYDDERKVVIDNTSLFLKGYNANNVLLYGDRGTGKSSTVKALINEYATSGLRMIEVPKAHLQDFPDIIRLIKDRPQKFILFVDDLAFEDSEESYTALKAILEGGLECRPSNAVIYATSNRRHLIKEKFIDRSGFSSQNPEDEVRSADSLQEKLSLADRFGITVTFSSPDKSRFLKIVDGLAEARNMHTDPENLHREALKWELWQNGRSPRTARQFIDWYEAVLKEKI